MEIGYSHKKLFIRTKTRLILNNFRYWCHIPHYKHIHFNSIIIIAILISNVDSLLTKELSDIIALNLNFCSLKPRAANCSMPGDHHDYEFW